MIKDQKATPSPSSNTQKSSVGSINVLYIQKVTEALTRKMRAAGVIVHTSPFKPSITN